MKKKSKKRNQEENRKFSLFNFKAIKEIQKAGEKHQKLRN